MPHAAAMRPRCARSCRRNRSTSTRWAPMARPPCSGPCSAMTSARSRRCSEPVHTNNPPKGRSAETSVFSSPSPTGFTALLFAVRSGSIEATKALLDAGADVNDMLSDGESALVVATANAHWELADVLLDRGADPNAAGAGWNALHQTVRSRRPNLGYTPGPVPTGSLDSINVVKKMIARGVRVNARMMKNGMKDGQRNRVNRLGATAFFLAAKNVDVEVMKVLADAGADARIPSADGTTPL